MNTNRYSVEVTTEGKFFIIKFPNFPQLFTQATHPREIEEMAKDIINLQLGAPIESIELDIQYVGESALTL